jgi:hypothetical protein
MRVLLDNLGHARMLWTKGICNALHGFEEIVDRIDNTLKIPWNGGNPVETGFLEKKGWNPPRTWGNPKSPWFTVGRL